MSETVVVSGDEVARLRAVVGDTELTDADLAAILVTMGSFDAAAAEVWGRKAASFASLVDVSESGSSRKLSDLHRNALAMQKMFTDRVAATAAPVASSSRARTRAIVRD